MTLKWSKMLSSLSEICEKTRVDVSENLKLHQFFFFFSVTDLQLSRRPKARVLTLKNDNVFQKKKSTKNNILIEYVYLENPTSLYNLHFFFLPSRYSSTKIETQTYACTRGGYNGNVTLCISM